MSLRLADDVVVCIIDNNTTILYIGLGKYKEYLR